MIDAPGAERLTSMTAALVAAGVPAAKAAAAVRRELGMPEAPIESPARDTRTEKAIEHAGDRLMQEHGFRVIRFSHPGKTQQTEGIPDRRYYHRGRRLAVWWEVKSATGRQRPGQQLFQELAEDCGEPYVLGTDEALRAWLAANGLSA